MNQIVNFYEKLEPEKTIAKDLLYIWGAWALLLVVYLVWSAMLLSQKWSDDESLQRLNEANTQIQKRIRIEGAKVDQQGLDRLAQELIVLRKERQGQQMLIDNLKDPSLSNIEGFSGVMRGLARQHQQGLALEKVEVTASGRVFYMAGKVLRPGDLPAYIVRLGEETAFENMAFEKIAISEKELALSFEVRSWSKI